jgi:hypothetical protein
MKLSRLSMFYLAGYLVPAGLMLLTMPRLVFVLFFSSQPDAYGDVMPRVAGALALRLDRGPLLLALAAMVGFGALLTAAGLVRDGRRPTDVT